MHYGLQKDTNFAHRDRLIFDKYGFEMPFRALQAKMAAAGYYLLDESDPSKSFHMHINLWMIKPKHYNTKYIWHELNVLPEDANVDKLKETGNGSIEQDACEPDNTPTNKHGIMKKTSEPEADCTQHLSNS